MAEVCPSCGSTIELQGRFCANCGTRLGGPTTGDQPPSEGLGYPAFTAPPYGQPLQMYPFPFPYYSRPPMTAARGASIAGGVMMIIDGVLALMAGLLLLFSYEEVLGTILLLGFVFSVISSVSVFLCRVPPLALLGPVVLMIGGIAFMSIGEEGPFLIGFVGMMIAVVSLGLVVSGFRDMRLREELRKNPMVVQMATSGPPGGMPPPYGVGPDAVKLNLRR